MSEKLELEAQAFNSQIEERIKHGHIPDLRYTEKCDYFYNNVWRHPHYVKLDFGEIFDLIKTSVESHIRKKAPRVLEVGCGPGFMSLELSRAGFDVVGLDLSLECIKVAQQFAAKDPHLHKRGGLTYMADDFFSSAQLTDRQFDAVVFVGALHHFTDQNGVNLRAKQLLRNGVIVIAHEPTRDRVSKTNAAFVQFLKVMLSINKGFFEEHAIPDGLESLENAVEKTLKKMRYELESGEKAQSINDNEAGFSQMYPSLNRNFEQLEFKERYAFFHEIIGGLRFDEKMNISLASYLKLTDRYFCDLGILQPTEFYFVGKKP